MEIKTYCCGICEPAGVTVPDFSWKVSDCPDKFQKAYKVIVEDFVGNILWDSDKVVSQNSVRIKYDGKSLKENTKYFWHVTVYTENDEITSKKSQFITGLFNTKKLTWITADKEINSPILYKEFELENISEFATINVCGLGFFELYLNGQKVSEDFMNPVRTDYDTVKYENLKYPFENETKKSVQYLTYEVSKYLKKGKNIIAVWLGNGWYRQRERAVEGIFNYGEYLKMFLKLTCEEITVESDKSWNVAESPVVYDNIFYGEIYDSRIKGEAKSVKIIAAPDAEIMPQLCPTDKIIKSYSPKSLSNGLYDAEICLSGFAEITIEGSCGDKVEIYYAEELRENHLDYESTAGYEGSDKNQIQKDVYVLSGNGEEKYMPRFVWHAFRYFIVTTTEGVTIKDVKVHYVCSSLKLRTKFNSSSDLLNTFHKNSINTAMSNMHGCVPMDCPHRERLGYTGDGQLASLPVMYNFDGYLTYKKWLKDIIDAQNKKTGFIPHTAPFNGGGGGPAWGSSISVVAWNLYMQYGDREILEEGIDALKGWIIYLSSKREDGLITHEESGSWCLGDWCMPSKYPWSEPHLDEIEIPSEIVNTVYYIYCMQIYSKMLETLGMEVDDGIKMEIENSCDAINRTYLYEYYGSGKQGCNVFPLFANVVPKDKEEDILKYIINSVEERDFCFDTGISGTKFLFEVLDRYERNDIAIKMLLNTKYPSYGYSITCGATALWETWEGNGSKSHTGLMSTDAWLFYGLAGIKPSGGYKEFSIKPFFAKEIDFLDVSLECEYGEIGLTWQKENGKIVTEITVPFNTTAHVTLKDKKYDLCAGKHVIGGIDDENL